MQRSRVVIIGGSIAFLRGRAGNSCVSGVVDVFCKVFVCTRGAESKQASTRHSCPQCTTASPFC